MEFSFVLCMFNSKISKKFRNSRTASFTANVYKNIQARIFSFKTHAEELSIYIWTYEKL